MPESKKSDKRLFEIDVLRGIAIIMMAVFHFMWDLGYLGVINKDLYAGFWGIFQKTTAILFISLAGLSLTLSYSRTIRKFPEEYPAKYLARGSRVFGYGLIITAISLIFFPKEFVFFGILHFIGLSIIIATPFIRFRWLNLALGLMALAFGFYLQQFTFSFPWLVWLGFMYPVNTLDLYTIFPWIGIVFLGMFFGNLLYPMGKRAFRIKSKGFLSACTSPVQFLGRHSLPMYFAHLPVVFGLAFVVSLF